MSLDVYADDDGFAAASGRAALLSDSAVADLIEQDGRRRLALGRPVTLRRYLDAIPSLAAMPVALDAAIDVALRGLSGGGGRPLDDAVAALVAQHPELELEIKEAAVIGEAMCSTTGLVRAFSAEPPRDLPRCIGPEIGGAPGVVRYELRQLLGSGASGDVYLAVDRQLSEAGHVALVAVKVLRGRLRDDWAGHRMLEEATKARRVLHPNVARVLDRGSAGGGNGGGGGDAEYIVYEFVDGGDLNHWLQKHETPIRERIGVIASVARGVQAAHAAGLVHCDLKPGNVLLTQEGEPKVADFGTAVRAGESAPARNGGGPVGNLAFISPEQFRGEEGSLNIPSDVYALGGILFFALTLTPPNGRTIEEVARNHDPREGRTEPPSPRALNKNVGRDLDAICRRAMALRPEDRYSSAGALAEDLESWLRSEPITWMRPSAARLMGLWIKRRPGTAAAILSSVLIAVGAVGAWSHYSSVAQAKAEETRQVTSSLDSARSHHESVYRTVAALKNVRFRDELLHHIMAWEWIYGPTVLGTADNRSVLWNDRIAVTRRLVAEARDQGRAAALDTLIWESALAFWLACDGDFEEAGPLLEQNLLAWSNRLDPSDPWLAQLAALQQCIAVSRAEHLAAAGSRPPALALAASAEAILKDEPRLFAGRLHGSPVHLLVLKNLARLYRPDLLNDRDRFRAITRRLQSLESR